MDHWRRRLLKARLGVVGASGAAEPPGLRLPGEIVVRYSVDPSTDAHACASVGLTGAFAGQGAPAWAAPASLAETPLERSGAGLQTWSYDRALPRPFLLVAGDTVEDFCLYLCWHRVYGDGSAAWLPAAAVAEARRGGDGWGAEVELVREMLLDLPGRAYDGGRISSFSLGAGELEPLRSALSAHHWHPDVARRFADMPIVAADDLLVPPAPPSYVAAGDVFDRPAPLVIDDDGTAWPVVRSPVPALMAAPGTAGSGAVLGNWVADVTVAGCRLPARRGAAPAAELDASLIDAGVVRAGRTGTAFVAVERDDLPSGLLVDHALTGLSLRDPDLGMLVTGLLPDGTRWELSDAGRFYQGLADMAGGLEALVAMLRDPAAYAVLTGFLNTAKAPGRAVLTDGRRYLRSFECREAIRRSAAGATTSAGTREVLDGLLAAKILSRGLVLKCSRCRHTAFQPLARIGDGFECPRCTVAQPLISAAWCGIPSHEPAWFYRLDELAYQALDKNVRVPALTLDRLGACSPRARHLWSIELWRHGRRWLELDFVCLADGRVSTGEAKSSGALKGKQSQSEVRKTVAGARALQADQVVFATTDRDWSEAVHQAAKEHTDVLAPPSPLLLSGLS
ncbi:MAG: hypothetical protein M3P50_10335 [Actinomycetota bacterium]|nr:hypothetical protein [Actinomycetota bacterium]